jgi:hypothetical protein
MLSLTSHVDLRCWPLGLAATLGGADRLPVVAFAGRFPAALALNTGSLTRGSLTTGSLTTGSRNTGSLTRGDTEPCPNSCAEVKGARLLLACFVAVVDPELAARVSGLDPVEDCELRLRTITGFLLDAAVLTTIFLVVIVVPFSPLNMEFRGSDRCTAGSGVNSGSSESVHVVSVVGVVPVAGVVSVGGAVEVVVRFFFSRDGNGGGGISEDVVAVPGDMLSPSLPPPSLESGGDAKRAVGRCDDVDGCRDFFKMGCGGGGLEDEGVGCFLFSIGAGSCAELSSRRLASSGLPRRPEPSVSGSTSNSSG